MIYILTTNCGKENYMNIKANDIISSGVIIYKSLKYNGYYIHQFCGMAFFEMLFRATPGGRVLAVYTTYVNLATNI